MPTAEHSSRISIFVALGRFSFRSLSYLSLYTSLWFEVNTTLLIKIRLIECDTKLNGDLLPMFQRGMLPPSSGQLTKGNQSSQATYSSLTMKAEARRSFKTSVLYLSINCVSHSPEDTPPHNHYKVNLKTHFKSLPYRNWLFGE